MSELYRVVVVAGAVFVLASCTRSSSAGKRTCEAGAPLTVSDQTLCIVGLGGLPAEVDADPQDGLMITETGAMPLPWYVTSPWEDVDASAYCTDSAAPFAHLVWRALVCSASSALDDGARNDILLLQYQQQANDGDLSLALLEEWVGACESFCSADGCAAPPEVAAGGCVEACLYGTVELALANGVNCASATVHHRQCLADAGCALDAACGATLTEIAGACPTSIAPSPPPVVAGVSVDPKSVDFGAVAVGTTATAEVTLSSTGDAALEITSLSLEGSPDFIVTWGDVSYEAGGGVVAFDPPKSLAAGTTGGLVVTFTPGGDSPAAGTLTLATNVADQPTVTVPLSGNGTAKCIEVAPLLLEYGAIPVGASSEKAIVVDNCGTTPITLSQVLLAEGSGAEFELAPTPISPIVPPGGSLSLAVIYTPTAAGTHEATMLIESDAPESSVEVLLKGTATTDDVKCPIAVIEVAEGEMVIPGSAIHLSGDESFGGSGNIAAYKWTVDQPSGSAGIFTPNPTHPNPTFLAEVVGVYTFELEVTDEIGTKSCEPAKATVIVIGTGGIHVEMTWSTPGDIDKTDTGPEAGADLDLHFLHPLAHEDVSTDGDKDGVPNGWFSQPWDCFWFNANPSWGELGNFDDDPHLDQDDTGSTGPENLNLDAPEEDLTYSVGVHYWNDHGYGDSSVAVRVYINAVLVVELLDVTLSNGDLWDIARIDWPSGQVTLMEDEEGNLDITPNYENPLFVP